MHGSKSMFMQFQMIFCRLMAAISSASSKRYSLVAIGALLFVPCLSVVAAAANQSSGAARTSTLGDQQLVQDLKQLLFAGTPVAAPQALEAAMAPLQGRAEWLSPADLKWLRYARLRLALPTIRVNADVGSSSQLLSETDDWIRQLATDEQDQPFVRLVWLARIEWLAAAMELGLKPDLLAFVLTDLAEQMQNSRIDPKPALQATVDLARIAVAAQLLRQAEVNLAAVLLASIEPQSSYYPLATVMTAWQWQQAPVSAFSGWLMQLRLAPQEPELKYQSVQQLRSLEAKRVQLRLMIAAGLQQSARISALAWHEEMIRHRQAIEQWLRPQLLAALYRHWEQQTTLPDSGKVTDSVRLFMDCPLSQTHQCHPLALRYVWDALTNDDIRFVWVNYKEAWKVSRRVIGLRGQVANLPADMPLKPVLRDDMTLSDVDGNLDGYLAWMADQSDYERRQAARQLHQAMTAELWENKQRLAFYGQGFRDQLLELIAQD